MAVERARLLASNGPYSRRPNRDWTRALASLGFTRLDLIPQTPHLWCGHTGYLPWDGLGELLDREGLSPAVLTPPPYRYSITAPPGDQRTATLAYYRVCISLAASLGCGQVVLGAENACWDLPRPELLRNAAELLALLAQDAQSAGVTLLLVPAVGDSAPLIAQAPVLGCAEELAQLLREVDSPALGVCLDTNVMAINGGTLSGWFELLGAHTGLVRLCDGCYHGWRAWGDGCLPVDRWLMELERLGYRGDISLHLPGEGYMEDPDYPHRAALAGLLGEV